MSFQCGRTQQTGLCGRPLSDSSGQSEETIKNSPEDAAASWLGVRTFTYNMKKCEYVRISVKM